MVTNNSFFWRAIKENRKVLNFKPLVGFPAGFPTGFPAGFPTGFPAGIPAKWGKRFTKISHFRKKCRRKFCIFLQSEKCKQYSFAINPSLESEKGTGISS